MKKLLCCCSMSLLLAAALARTARAHTCLELDCLISNHNIVNVSCSGGHTCKKHNCGYQRDPNCDPGCPPPPQTCKAPTGIGPLDGILAVVVDIIATPAYASHGGSDPDGTNHYGYLDGNIKSGTTGRAIACAAKTDVCFGAGHDAWTCPGSVEECENTCGSAQSRGNSCSDATCIDRCKGACGFQTGCS